MSPPSDLATALQRAIMRRLSQAIVVEIGSATVPVYDNVPEVNSAAYPYVAIGDDQVVPDVAEGLEDSADVTSTIHVFSARIGRLESKRIIGQIRRHMMTAPLDLAPDWAVVDQLFGGSHVVEDEDGTTTHGIVTFRFLVDAVSA